MKAGGLHACVSHYARPTITCSCLIGGVPTIEVRSCVSSFLEPCKFQKNAFLKLFFSLRICINQLFDVTWSLTALCIHPDQFCL